MDSNDMQIETKAVHSGEPEPRIEGAVSIPIFQSSTYEFDSGSGGGHDDIRYIRLNNTPNHQVLHRRLAALENAQEALVAASGAAAITTSLLTVLSSGDHLLTQDNLYGGTYRFISETLPKLGISFDFIDSEEPSGWERKLRPNTRAIYVETISNPLLQIPDLKAVVAFARQHQLVSLIDNTFASPVNFRPPEWGFDLSLHSATKYLNGHTDIVAGAVIGDAQWVRKIHLRLNQLGGTLDPHACFLLYRGLKTLPVRMRYQSETAMKLTSLLAAHDVVSRVNYPGLPDHPGHHRAVELLDGFGAMFSFELKGEVEAAERFLQRLKLPIVAPSLGGVESLVTRPATTSHSAVPPEERRKLGISDTLIRVSVGIEGRDDLLEDFSQALGAV